MSSSLLNSYDRITSRGSEALSLIAKASGFGKLYRMFNTWVIPAAGEVFLSALTPDFRSALVIRELDAFDGAGLKYRALLGGTDVVYNASPDPEFVTPGSAGIWRKVDTVTLTSAILIDSAWIPEVGGPGDSGGLGGGEVLREQPANTEFILAIANPQNAAIEFKISMEYIEDPNNLILPR